MEEQIQDACRVIMEDKNNYIAQVNQAEDLYPVTMWSHFICGIPNSEMNDDVKIEGFELLDFDKPIPMDFYAFGQVYFQIEEHHFTDNFKIVRKNNDILKNNLMYMIYNMRSILEPNDCYCLAIDHEKYRHYDMDLDEIFDEEKLHEYMSKVRRNNFAFTRYHLPVIKGFKLSIDTKYNMIKCEILLLE
jgi:hypothetical protein